MRYQLILKQILAYVQRRFFLVSVYRFHYVILLLGACSAVSAIDNMMRLPVINGIVRSVDDITALMPFEGLFSLDIGFAESVTPVERTRILQEAFDDERASRMIALDLNNNDLIEVPPLGHLQQLQSLNLSDNRLVRPPVLTGLSNLRKLYLEENSLIEPPVLNGLINLEELCLDHNQLVDPPVLTDVVNLRWLSLAHNRLSRPPILAGLHNMEFLLLAYNQLRQPPELTGLTRVRKLDLFENPLEQPVIIPHALEHTLSVESIRAPYRLEQAPVARIQTTLVDIATPGVDTMPFFFTLESIIRLPEPKLNPLTRREILQTMNLVESWRYWRDHGISAQVFDAKLKEIEPVLFEENIYTVDRQTAFLFMQERGFDNARAAEILGDDGDEIAVSALLEKMYTPLFLVGKASNILGATTAACTIS